MKTEIASQETLKSPDACGQRVNRLARGFRLALIFLSLALLGHPMTMGAVSSLKSTLSTLKSLSTVSPRGECKMAPDTTKGGLNSKQVPALLRGVGIDQRLNQQVPLDLPFR
ncbi:MAG: hypothetical protein ACRD2G_00335, partial [Terriglobia bacterium]